MSAEEGLPFLLVGVRNGDMYRAEDNAVAVDYLDFALLNNKRTVHTQEAVRGQTLLHGLHAAE